MQPSGNKPAFTPVILCADDYGLDRGITAAILDLASQNRLTAASCMVNSPGWPAAARRLAAVKGKIAVGLHLTFTELMPLAAMPRAAPDGLFPPLGALMRAALLRTLSAREIAAECRRQIDAFTAHAGHPPHYIDGHQHVHCFPVIRQAVLRAARKLGCPVRYCGTPLAAIRRKQAQASRAYAVNLLGCGFAAALRRQGIPYNRQFFGLHAFDPSRSIGALFNIWLAAARPGCLINCHPSSGIFLEDPIAAWRQYEYAWLAGPQCPELFAKRRCRVATLEDWPKLWA